MEILYTTTMPEASDSEVGKYYKYNGETTAEYTNGNIYTCISTTTEDITTYSWVEYTKPEIKYFSKSNVHYLLNELTERLREAHINE